MLLSGMWDVVPLQNANGGSRIVSFLIFLLIAIVFVAGMWKAFQKANEPGWAAIIPIYNVYVMVKIGGNAWWWVLLFFIPVISIIAVVKVSIDVAKAFGQGLGFGIGLALLGVVFWPLLGFGDYRYQGPPAERP